MDVVDFDPDVASRNREQRSVQSRLGQIEIDREDLAGRQPCARPGCETLTNVFSNLARGDQLRTANAESGGASDDDDARCGLGEFDGHAQWAAIAGNRQAVLIFDALFSGIQRAAKADGAVLEGEAIANRTGARRKIGCPRSQAPSHDRPHDRPSLLPVRESDDARARARESKDLANDESVAHPVDAYANLVEVDPRDLVRGLRDLEFDFDLGLARCKGHAHAEGNLLVTRADEIDDVRIGGDAGELEDSLGVGLAASEAGRAVLRQGIEGDRDACGLSRTVGMLDLYRQGTIARRRRRSRTHVAGMLRRGLGRPCPCQGQGDEEAREADHELSAKTTKSIRRRAAPGVRSNAIHAPASDAAAACPGALENCFSGCGHKMIRQPKTKRPPPVQPKLTSGLR